ncbi:hypothetical protein FVEG_11108 [Fusarium verticillioides 7600]|uniref:Uncharacterized protein n=1 Tax=Gibberella moniliformis (strain M3125 / FGSC 7600) TaxID=334819 RepID=W7MX05_GIBM7|nr:hypothetical protein FVEG_11108 [Fusarium verticillioides 7600]EWG52334.1 hypothetical protein FVEG_11108 [Fusarium verticillioides 7600]
MNAVMGTMDFSARQCIQSKDKFWSGDPVETIKTTLQVTRSRHPTPEVTPGRRGSSVCSTGNGAQGMRTPAGTPRNGARERWELSSYDQKDIFGNETPKTKSPKRRHTDSAESVSFDVRRKLHDAAFFISEQKLPELAALQKEIDDRRKERNKHGLVIKSKKEELERCQTKRASQVRVPDMIDTEVSKLGDDIAAGEKAAGEELAVLPPPTIPHAAVPARNI